MQRCIELARNGAGKVSPNPLVGCVIVHNGKIIGEGYHQKYGEAHAEVNAVNDVIDKDLLKQSTLYVNLEPCAHFGKTPPCADLIVKHQIPEVVIGCVDTFSEVAGKGIKKLKDAGCKVTTGILEHECRELNKRFFTYVEKKRPYVILKWAQTADGFMASSEPLKQLWISNKYSKMLVHKWRTEEDAVMVGTNTALYDNPQLNVREWAGRNPSRIVLDKNLRLPADLSVFKKDGVRTLILNSKKEGKDENLEFIKLELEQNSAKNILSGLYNNGVQSIIIEGGAALLNIFIEDNEWDECLVFSNQVIIKSGLKAPHLNIAPVKTWQLDSDNLQIFKS